MFIETHNQQGTNNPLGGLFGQTKSKYSFVMFMFSIFVLFSLFVDTALGTNKEFDYIHQSFILLFSLDFLYRLGTAENKLRFMKTNGIDFFLTLPFYPTTWLIVGLSFRALKSIVEYVLMTSHNAFRSMFIIGLTLTIFSTVSILQFEIDPNCNIKGIGDAMWWSICTITTVGYGDKFPITSGGKIVAIILMICGIGLFGTLIGYISSYFTDKEKDNNDKVDTIEELSKQIHELRNELKK